MRARYEFHFCAHSIVFLGGHGCIQKPICAKIKFLWQRNPNRGIALLPYPKLQFISNESEY